MATIRIHGRKALIQQHFNDLPTLLIAEFRDSRPNHKRHEWSADRWQKRVLMNNKNMEE